MENPAQVPKQISSLEEHFSKQTAVIPKEPSKIHLARILLKLLPVAFKFRRDRRKWVKQEGLEDYINKSFPSVADVLHLFMAY